jgi:hypothetical protein
MRFAHRSSVLSNMNREPPAMKLSARSALLVAFAAALCCGSALAQKKTVCTITVNSENEKETMRARLPHDKFQFVELVEHGRPDWLASACHKGVQCDVLVISGHFAGTNFFSEEIETQEFLPVDEMERVSCSDSCPGLFSRLKEVYLFGCNTLNGENFESNTAEVARSLMRAGSSKSEAERQSKALTGRYGETNRDRMRRIFANVPVIYGFSSKAPMGPAAAGSLSRYLQMAGGSEIGTGRVSTRLLGQFGNTSLTATSGTGSSGPQASYRQEVCQFYDDRKKPADKVDFVHQLFARNMTEVRMFLQHIEKFSSSMTDAERKNPAVDAGLRRIAEDKPARERYLAFAREMDRPEIRARMVKLAGSLEWLTAEGLREELVGVTKSVLAQRTLTTADVDFVCGLNERNQLDTPREQFGLSQALLGDAGHSAALACLGSADDHARQLAALSSRDARDVQIAQVYFRHRPISDVGELRVVAGEISRMPESEAKVVALETLSRHYLTDRETITALASAFPRTESVTVQRAIAGILLRADLKTVSSPDLLRTVSESRVRSSGGRDIIDVLIKRLRASSGGPMAG